MTESPFPIPHRQSDPTRHAKLAAELEAKRLARLRGLCRLMTKRPRGGQGGRTPRPSQAISRHVL